MWRTAIFLTSLATITTAIYSDGRKVQLLGTLAAMDSIDDRCSDALMQGFRGSVSEVIDQVTYGIRQGHVAACPSDLKVSTGDMQFIIHNTQIRVIFSIGLIRGVNPTIDDLTSDSCLTAVSDHVKETSSWRSPVVASVTGCPRVTFSTDRFDVKK